MFNWHVFQNSHDKLPIYLCDSHLTIYLTDFFNIYICKFDSNDFEKFKGTSYHHMNLSYDKGLTLSFKNVTVELKKGDSSQLAFFFYVPIVITLFESIKIYKYVDTPELREQINVSPKKHKNNENSIEYMFHHTIKRINEGTLIQHTTTSHVSQKQDIVIKDQKYFIAKKNRTGVTYDDDSGQEDNANSVDILNPYQILINLIKNAFNLYGNDSIEKTQSIPLPTHVKNVLKSVLENISKISNLTDLLEYSPLESLRIEYEKSKSATTKVLKRPKSRVETPPISPRLPRSPKRAQTRQSPAKTVQDSHEELEPEQEEELDMDEGYEMTAKEKRESETLLAQRQEMLAKLLEIDERRHKLKEAIKAKQRSQQGKVFSL